MAMQRSVRTAASSCRFLTTDGAGFAFLGDCRRNVLDPEPSLVPTIAAQLRTKAEHMAPCKWAFIFLTGWDFTAVRVCSLLTLDTGLEFSAFLKPDDAESR